MSIAGVTGSSVATTAALQTGALGGTTTPVVDEANLPPEIRNGTADQKKAYQAALSFESVLVSQMTKGMMATTGMPGTGGASDSSNADSSFGNGASSQMLASTLPDTLASAIMNNGGLGLAKQLDTSYPTATTTSLSQPSKNGAVSTDTTTTPSSTTTADASSGAGQGGTAA